VASTDYDDVPYPGHAHAETHPNRLAAVARLSGMDAPKVETARVLEIACGDGGNLIPIAYSLPRAHCVGFDLAPTAVARAQERVGRLQLTNADIRVAGLATVRETGQFDYVIAHGLYSWVPRDLRDALLALVGNVLSSNGIAFVSYNVYPGWHAGRMVREMLRYHTRDTGDAATRVFQARALLDFLVVAHDAGDAYGRLLAAECERIAKHSSAHLFHDDLADVNDPVYFHEFVAHAAGFGLAFLAEADFSTMTGAQLPEAARSKLDELRGDPVLHGQYLDFVKCRRFRETLLRRATTSAAMSPVPGGVRTLLAASAATAGSQPVDLGAGVEAQFRWGERASLKTDHPLAKATFLALRERWPAPVPFDALVASSCALLGRAACTEDANAVESILLGAFGLRMVELTAERWGCTATPGDRPRASALARLDAEASDVVTTLAHRRARIDEALALRLLRLCDGTRDADTLGADLAAAGHSIDRTGVQQRLDGFAKLELLEG
jgi:SAM-dependent methyltransferase